MRSSARPLGDSPERSYAGKLDRFGAFAAPELCRVFADLGLPAHGTALDLGCGTGFATALLADTLGPDVVLVGVDLSLPHLEAARRHGALRLIQGDAERLCFAEGSFDFIWCCNTVNHVADSVGAVRSARARLRAGGRLVLAQSAFLPEMFFAWDSHLDDAVRSACHRYYRERYGLKPGDTAGLRALLGLMQAAGFETPSVRTYVIERTQPLSQTDRDYFREAVFDGLWGDRIRPFLDPASAEALARNCDPASPDYCLDRPDFHHVQTITVCEGSLGG